MNAQEMYDRDSGQCMACGTTRGLTTQHRLNRKMGGRQGDAKVASEAPSNRMTLCFGCNTALERDERFARTARRMGWKLEEHEDPARVAVFHAGFREWRLLDDDGSYTVVPGRDDHDLGWAS